MIYLDDLSINRWSLPDVCSFNLTEPCPPCPYLADLNSSREVVLLDSTDVYQDL